MKTIFLTFVLSCSLCVLNSFGQTEKGTYMLGGEGSAGFSFREGNYQFNVQLLSPKFGYFLFDKFATGSSIYLQLLTNDGYTFLYYDISPFLRYYFGKGSKIKYFATGAFSLGGSTSINGGSDTNIHIAGNAGLGGVYFLNKSIGLETTLKYNYYKSDISESYSSSNISLGFGFQIYFSRQGN